MGRRRRGLPLNPSEAAERQSLFRDVNERIQELGARWEASDEPVQIVCECGDGRCHEMVAISVAEYESLRRRPSRFAVRHGHELLEIERVVERGDRFLVVEKLGVGGRVATARDPRRDSSAR